MAIQPLAAAHRDRRVDRTVSLTTVDVLVAGAGPAGSALAARLAHAGASVLLVEASAHPRPKACAEYASPRVVEELARLGVGPGWTELAVALEGMDLYAGGRMTPIRYADRRGPRSAWGVDRRTFDAMLARHAVDRGAVLMERTRVASLVVEAGLRIRWRSSRWMPRVVTGASAGP